MGNKLGEWSGAHGSQASEEKEFIGVANHYFPKAKVGQFFLNSGGLRLNDDIIITGATTGLVRAKAKSLFVGDRPQREAKKGDVVTVKLEAKIRRLDKLFVIKKRKNKF